MRRLVALFVCLVSSFAAAAAQPGAFARRQQAQAPGFFIPDGAIAERKEVLPAFDIPKPTQGGVKHAEKPAPAPAPAGTSAPAPAPAPTAVAKAEAAETPKAAPKAAEEFSAPMAKPAASPYMDLDFAALAGTPEFKRKYDDYLADLAVIEQTGKAPENAQLQADLATMDSDERRAVR